MRARRHGQGEREEPGLFDKPSDSVSREAEESRGEPHRQEPGGIAVVALPLPVEREFDYRIPETLRARVQPGVRLRVPFARRVLTGICVGVKDASRARGLKDVQAVLEDRPILAEGLLRLTRWIADETGCSWGEAIDAAIPGTLRRGRGGGGGRVLRAELAIPESEALGLLDDLASRRPKQERALRSLLRAGGEGDLQALLRTAHITASPFRTLARRGVVRLEWRIVAPAQVLPPAFPYPHDLSLTPDQQASLDAVVQAVDAGASQTFLLHGVTGSGKTEVYLQAIARVLQRGRQAILLVPEIALTPQSIARIRSRFPKVAALHSGLSDGERRRQWEAIRRGTMPVVVGARSAVFAPCPSVGILVVDEEHEVSFKQETTPRYHARDVARERGRIEGAPVLLGSATPSLESWQAAREKTYHLLRLTERVGGGSLPPVRLVDLAEEIRLGRRFTLLSRRMRDAVVARFSRREQVILFLNRRGYASFLLCRRCGSVVHCPSCSVSLTYHRAYEGLLCHYCFHEQKVPAACPTCRAAGLKLVGIGTQRVEEEVRRVVPGAVVVRMDSDTMTRRGSYDRVLGAFEKGEIDVLVGTQMVGKGLDFPNVTLVGVVSADTSLTIPDFRAAERTFQLVAQVAGRAGRGEKAGEVLVQTFDPGNASLRAACVHDYESFARGELRERRTYGYPPFGRLLRAVFSSTSSDRLREVTDQARNLLDRWRWSPPGEGLPAGNGEGAMLPGGEAIAGPSPALPPRGKVVVLGPVPAPISKIRDRLRWHLMGKAAEVSVLRTIGRELRALDQGRRGVHVQVDLQPVAMM